MFIICTTVQAARPIVVTLLQNFRNEVEQKPRGFLAVSAGALEIALVFKEP